MFPTVDPDDDLDINKLDFEWVQKTEKPRLLKKAMKILVNDGFIYNFQGIITQNSTKQQKPNFIMLMKNISIFLIKEKGRFLKN